MDEIRSRASRRPRHRSAPLLEALEGRRLLAARVAQVGFQELTQGGSTKLVVTGTNRADVIHVADDGSASAGNVTVTLGDGSTYTSRAAISMIDVRAKGGDDQVSYDLTSSLVATRVVQLSLGAGNDRFIGNVSGDINDPIGLDLEVYGEAGNDNLAINQSGATTAGTFVGYLDGAGGNDTLTYAGTGTIAAGASILPALSGGAGNDVISSSYSGRIDGSYIYNLTIDGGAGNDNIADDVNVAALSTGTVGTSSAAPASLQGGAGNDKIRFAVRVDPGANLAGVNAVILGGRGKDSIQKTSNVLHDRTSEESTIVT